MTRLSFLFALLIWFSGHGLAQDVILNTQAAVDAFDPTTTTITGFLYINGIGSADQITDLSPLSGLTSVGGFLNINNNAALTDVDGLSGLTTVGGYLDISSNAALMDVDGLSGLTTVGGNLWINNNAALTDVDGLSGLTAVGGNLWIYNNAALTNVDGLSGLTSVVGYLLIEWNAALTQVDGLSGLTSVVGYLWIRNNAALTNVDGLSGLTSVGGYLRIDNNASLTNVDGLSGLTSVGGYFRISSNNALTEVDGLSGLTSAGGYLRIDGNNTLTNVDGLSGLTSVGGYLSIYENAALTNVDGLSGLTTVGGDLRIYNNAALTNVDGFSGLTSVGGYLSIDDNAVLTNVDGLSGLTSVGGYLRIEWNAALTNVDGLSGLTSLGGYLRIDRNAALTNVDGLSGLTSVGEELRISNSDALTNVDGLSGLTSVGGYLRIYDNAALTDCCGIQVLLSTPGAIGGPIDIFDNPSECSSPEEVINSSCGMNLSVLTFPPCIGVDNGSIQIDVNGYDTLPLMYGWERVEDGAMDAGTLTTDVFSIDDLSAGTYNIRVTSPRPDTAILSGIVLNQIAGSIFEIIELTGTNSSNGLSNGSILVTLAGGTPPFNYTWSGQASGNQSGINDMSFSIPNLAQGEYLIRVSDAVGNWQEIAITLLDETVPVFPCTEPLDIVILNDVSGSVDATEYAESKQFFVDFLDAANIGTGPMESRAAIIEWSSRGEQSIQIPMTGDAPALQAYTSYSRTFDGGTDPHDAMVFGEDYLASVGRTDVEKVLILSTDGSSGQVSPSLVALADEYKAAGYHVATIAFDNAFSSSYTRDLLSDVASIDLLAPGAPAYSDLDQNLAENIVNLYLCPIDPGSSATAYFNRDGAIDISGIVPVGNCPYPDQVEITFTVEALRELSIPAGTPITFYHNNPSSFGATPIMTWLIPCAIPVGSTETFTVTLPVSIATNIFAVLNDDGSESPPISLPITDIDELAYSNNIDNIPVCTDPIATLQALKYTTTPIPICNSIVIYTIDVCNISGVDATGVVVTDVPPPGFVLEHIVVNDNGCATDQGGVYDIPAGCCVSLTLTYDASGSAHDFYTDQDVGLSGPGGQTYIDFDGATTSSEDVLIDGTIDCPSTTIAFTKSVQSSDVCDDGFVVFTFTIDNQLNVPLQGLEFSDILPAPVTWTFRPYGLSGLTIGHSTIIDGTASFIIDEVEANTVATFSMDALLGDWLADGTLNNSATLMNVPDLVSGGVQTLTSNTTTTTVRSTPDISIIDTIRISSTQTTIDLDAMISGSSTVTWTTSGDGSFNPDDAAATIYTIGSADLVNEEISLFISSESDCGEDGRNVVVLITEEPCMLSIDTESIGICDDNGTNTDPTDDTYEVLLNISAVNGGSSNTYSVTDGTNAYGPFTYGQDEAIILPADGMIYTLMMTDTDDPTCTIQTDVSQMPCSSTCDMSIDTESIGLCDDNGTNTDPTDDTYEVILNISVVIGGQSNTYSVTDGTNVYGPFTYGQDEAIILPADGMIYTLIMTDTDDPTCTTQTDVSQMPCSSTCDMSIDTESIGLCDDNGTETDPTDDTYEVILNISAVNGGSSNTYSVTDGTNVYGPFTYGQDEAIILPADGMIYTLIITDTDDPTCTTQTDVSRTPCSSTCDMSIDTESIGICDDNGTETDPTDDTYEVLLNISAVNGGPSNTYSVTDGTNVYGPFTYGQDEAIILPADGMIYTLMITDTDDPTCTTQTDVSQTPCSSTCDLAVYYRLEQPLCPEDVTGRVMVDSIVGMEDDYLYSIDNNDFIPFTPITDNVPAVIDGLLPGEHNISFVTASDETCRDDIQFEMVAPSEFTLDLGADETICIGEEVQLRPTSNLAPSSLIYKWVADETLSCLDCAEPIATPQRTTTYTLEATNADGCIVQDNITVTVIDDYEVYIPNAFTPNGDGINDDFTIYPGKGVAEISEFNIFGRWGEQVYRQEPIVVAQLPTIDGWGGLFKGEQMDGGVYIYSIVLTLDNGRQVELSGDLTLIR